MIASSGESTVHAWIADDGELFALRTLLRENRIPFSDVPEDPPQRVDLLVSNPRRALDVEKRRSLIAPRMHIVLARALTRTMRQRLQRSSCDFIVEEDVHPGALRLLLEYALYRGPERRSNTRVPMGVEVKLKVGWRQRKATLLQISERGCGVAMDAPVDGNDIVLRLPGEWMQGKRMEVPVRILDQQRADGVGQIVSLGFIRMDGPTQRALRLSMKRASQEMGRLAPGRCHDNAIPDVARKVSAKKSPAKKSSARTRAHLAAMRKKPPKATIALPALPAPNRAPAAELPSADRRQNTRAHYMKRVMATRGGQTQVVIGQDISVGGMRIGKDLGISVGDEMKLALYGSGQDDRVIVRARVVRDDGPAGLGVRFEGVSAEVQERINKLVDAIPILGRAAANAKKRPGIVVSEILDRETREDGD